MTLQVGQLAGKGQRVQGHVSFDTPAVQEGHHLGQVGPVEVVGPDSRVMALEAEIDGVGAVLDGGDQAGSIPGRRQQLGLDPREGTSDVDASSRRASSSPVGSLVGLNVWIMGPLSMG